MSNSNFHRARPQSTRYSNNYHSSRVTYDHSFDSNQRFYYEKSNENEQRSNQQSPGPLLVPSSQQTMFNSPEQFHSNHTYQSNNRHFHHSKLSSK